MPDTILVIDYGSQYTHVIARRVRELGVYSQAIPYTTSVKKISSLEPKGIILSGGPNSVYEKGSPSIDPTVFDLGIPVLGICYGLQLMAHVLGGEVVKGTRHEYSPADVTIRSPGELFKGIPQKTIRVWMSHGDQVHKLPKGFTQIADSPSTENCVAIDPKRKLYGIQFHPEVSHTPQGITILKNFVVGICNAKREWKMADWIKQTQLIINNEMNMGQAICALSGGVDSTVAATLVHEAIGSKLHCIYVNTGMMRKNETEQVMAAFKALKLPVKAVDATTLFLKRLRGVTDPEQKRMIIGKTFIDVFEKEAKTMKGVTHLVQGTLYSDVIESAVPHQKKGHASHTIKSHHNVGGLPERLALKLLEPVRELFKDEVRSVGKELGIPAAILGRHPFPGPGLAIRIIGEITPQRLEILRGADAIMTEEIKTTGWYDKIWQSAAILTGVRSVAVMGDARTYHEVCAIRLVHSLDAMTAHWVQLPYPILEKISNRIVNEVRGISRVVYDITNKPPATIQWE